jgi:hypothetical protein
MTVFRRRFAIATLFGVVIGGSFLACGYDWDFVDGGIGSDGSIAIDSGDTALEAASDALVTGDVGTGGTCSPSQGCVAANVCVYSDHLCGTGEKTGTCVVASVGTCTPVTAGNEYCFCSSSAAAGQLAHTACITNVDLDAIDGSCAAAAAADGVFQCGYEYCKRGSDFCVTYSEDGGMHCDTFPPNCDASACDCAKEVTCVGGTCPGLGSGTVGPEGTLQLHLTCP